ncbi:ABC transporter permease [Neobacillus sp. MM2021_6]|uniref:ABC transporter permease n=1 Tax=Bacillaceae TaxID=186817 RepID=UPI00140C4D9B|nr:MULTISPECIES: ABC transporter permease [Bacillaceae]MBO0958736.1 ABC transporter permease [Neobacillus sp. MM2021_6]NHC18170.1 ABC transporter permease [Bacillus sp. MM2020_4]
MTILHIAWKGIKSDFRDRRTLFFMLAFPILLILVLGTALSNTFTSSLPVDDLHVLYKDTTQEGSFQQFRAGAEASGIHFKKATEKMDGKKEVKQDTYDGYIEVSDKGVQLYINNGNSINANILQGMLAAYVDKFNIASEIRKTAPDKLEEAFTSRTQANFIKETSLNPEKKPGSLDYYAIAITTMIILYGAMSASSLIVGERVRKTADRLIAAPVRKSEIFIGKVLGSLISNGLCVILVILFSKLLFKANWGNHLGLVFLVLLSEVVLAVSIGIGVSFLAKTSAAPQVIIMLFVQLSSFFGGAYFKIENPEGIFKLITDLSPLTWMNTAITKIIYANDFAAAIPAIGINLIGSFLLLLVAIISLQRREGL